MAPQLYTTIYKEQFRLPGKVKRTELRPTSAHRRNNPQPRQDFLFPHSLQKSYKPTCALSQPLTQVGIGGPFFPPLRHFSFHNPVTACLETSLTSNNAGKAQHMPPVSAGKTQSLPSADMMQKLQLARHRAGPGIQHHTTLKNPLKTVDNQRNVNSLTALQLVQQAGPQLQTRPQTTAAAPTRLERTQFRKCCSKSSLDYSGCYSCFHVVRPYQAGHYIIHPEFVSESLY
ncbi:uncharacterized protein ACNS7B_005304 [Menidia menidia]